MTNDNDVNEIEERLADAQAQIETLQSAAADATARAATAQAELLAAREAQGDAMTRAEQAEAEREASAGEASVLRSRLQEATGRYRAVRLAASPDVPAELVPELATIEEIDQEMEAAQRVVGQLRERIQKEALEQRGAARIPAGSPGRRSPDLSSLPASEKIRVGLQQLSEREGR